MDIFIISDNSELCEQVVNTIPHGFTFRVLSFQKELSLEEICKNKPALIIVVSTTNEAWGWWMAGELIFRLPDLRFIMIQKSNNLSFPAKLTDSVFLITDPQNDLSLKISEILQEVFPDAKPGK